MNIKLRQRTTKAGTTTLYLDYYDHGRRWLEYLSLYLVGDKPKDKETLRLAETIRAQRQLDAVAGAHGLPAPSRQHGNFIDYCRKLGESKPVHNTRLVWKHAVAKLESFAPGGTIAFSKVDETFLQAWRDYLLRSLKPNAAIIYLARIKTACRQATRERLFARNPAENVLIRKTATNRQYLTLAELKKLKRTQCKSDVVKAAFLFSAFSGLRFSDVRALRHDQVKRVDGNYAIEFRQTKTGDVENLPLSDEAARILKSRKLAGNGTAVFDLPAQQTIHKAIGRWVRRAGIDKTISFHNARHTFATLGLTHGVDLYTMSKLLGHRDVSTTQIYAKIVDEKKRAAVELFPRLSGREARNGKDE